MVLWSTSLPSPLWTSPSRDTIFRALAKQYPAVDVLLPPVYGRQNGRPLALLPRIYSATRVKACLVARQPERKRSRGGRNRRPGRCPRSASSQCRRRGFMSTARRLAATTAGRSGSLASCFGSARPRPVTCYGSARGASPVWCGRRDDPIAELAEFSSRDGAFSGRAIRQLIKEPLGFGQREAERP